MKYFICSMANDGRKNIVPLLTDSVLQLEKFAEDHDQPGRAVYACVNPLRSDATARAKDQVEAIVTLHVDIDFKRLATPPDEVRQKVMEQPLPFEVRESGGGLHVLANLKEAYENGTEHFRRAEGLRTQLMTLLCGDPAPNHSAALLRVVGTHNSKYGEPVEVSVIRAGELVDIVDVEAFLDLYPRPLFELEDGYLPASNVVSLDVPFVPIDTDAVLGDMPTTGEGVNAVQYRLLRALIVREGMTPQEAVDAVVSATMTMAAAHQPDWTFDVEFKCVTARMKWVLGRLEKEHWAAVDAGRRAADEPPDWVPVDWRAPWTAGCKAGGTPHVHRNGYGYCIRTAGAAKADGSPQPESASAAANDTADQPRHYRFRLVDFEDMIPDEVSHYLVDELLPEKGIGMVWGKPKCLKSFCVLDICFHIARGWPYHDRAVKQGGVVYCAFEGGYGYKKRVAALRAHYHLEGEPKGATDLKIVPSSAPNLVKDHTQLVRELTEQLAGVLPRVVVLDTLNKSISGSESKDEDMAAYIRAAESIRNAFDCLVIIVHHCGWDESRPRGHSSLPGAVDVQIRIERDEHGGTLTATVELMRDGPEGGQVHLRAEEIVVGFDKKNQKDLTSLVLVAEDPPPAATTATGRKAGRPNIHLPIFLKALSDCIGRAGRSFIPDGVDTVRAAELSRVAEEFHRRYVASGDTAKALDAERKAFDACVTKAREEGRIQVMRDVNDVPLAWFTKRGAKGH